MADPEVRSKWYANLALVPALRFETAGATGQRTVTLSGGKGISTLYCRSSVMGRGFHFFIPDNLQLKTGDLTIKSMELTVKTRELTVKTWVFTATTM